MVLKCPLCSAAVDSKDFEIKRGTRGGFFCPACGKMLHFAQGYQPLRVTLAICVSFFLVLVVGFTQPLIIAVMTLVCWPVTQLLVNGLFARYFKVSLKPWKLRGNGHGDVKNTDGPLPPLWRRD